MRKSVSTVITVSCFADEPAFQLYCEPEGAEHEVAPGDVLAITFEGTTTPAFEISRVSDGLVLCRTTDAAVTISDKRGRDLRW